MYSSGDTIKVVGVIREGRARPALATALGMTGWCGVLKSTSEDSFLLRIEDPMFPHGAQVGPG